MPKDRDQQTPVEPDDADRIASRRQQGTGSSGEDVLPGEPSAPGGEASSGMPAAVDELPADQAENYE